ncbi:GmrSD restriction endonuclease domain-containing protein [Chromobacterium vaccinii]|uniref:GmrSD restriction endonuclease domain-containing protein n=1 Tax=Chromobacterium vaccinii TaxID=1108595 RepID=UPI0031D6E0B8
MDYQPYSIRKLLEAVISGNVRIPAFQRGFVWDMDRVAHLMDSIYKGYPFGSLLFWRTRNQLAIEKDLGQFKLPTPEADFPFDYVIDGQQRLTSIFTVFQSTLSPVNNIAWSDIYFDYTLQSNAQDCQFVALPITAYDKEKFFPLKVLFDSVKYREATEGLSASAIGKIDKLQEVFKETSIPVQILKTENKSTVAVVFERVNRLGMALDTLQLLSAWTWDHDFDLIEKFKELRESLEDFGFEEVGENSDLILSTAGAILTGKAAPESLLEISGQQIRENFDLVENGIKGAIDFLRSELKVYSLKSMPFPSMIIPLSTFFASKDGKEIVFGGDALSSIKKWFWRSCLSNRYSSQTRRTAEADCIEMIKLKNGDESKVTDISVKINAQIFKDLTFRVTNSFAKTFILLLTQKNPKSFFSGKLIEAEKVLQLYNRSEFHHIYPKAFLRKNDVPDESINCLANFCYLSSAENKKISNKKPSDYIRDLVANPKDEILGSAFCTVEMFDDNFDKFIEERSKMLFQFSMELADL